MPISQATTIGICLSRYLKKTEISQVKTSQRLAGLQKFIDRSPDPVDQGFFMVVELTD